MADYNDLTTTEQTNNARWPENTLTIGAINNSARTLESMIARNYRDMRGTLTLSGGPTAYTCVFHQDDTPMFDGLRVCFMCNTTNNNDPTLNTLPLVMSSGTPLIQGDMRPGCIYEAVQLNGSWVMIGADHNRRRDRLRLQPGTEDLPTWETFTNRDDAAELIQRWQAFARNKATPTPANIQYGAAYFAIVSPTPGAEQGEFFTELRGSGVDTRALRVRHDQATLGGQAFQGPKTFAIPSDWTFLKGTAPFLVDVAPKNIRRFTANGTYARPASLLGAIVFVIGGGGSGARNAGGGNTGGGGGAGGMAISCLPVTSIPTSVAVTVGAGGVNPTPSGNGNDGDASQFLDLIGEGGEGGAAAAPGDPGAGGSAEGGQLNVTGPAGTPGGGAGAFRSAGAPGFWNMGGAGGHGASTNTGEAAGPGQAGAVIVLEF